MELGPFFESPALKFPNHRSFVVSIILCFKKDLQEPPNKNSEKTFAPKTTFQGKFFGVVTIRRNHDFHPPIKIGRANLIGLQPQ